MLWFVESECVHLYTNTSNQQAKEFVMAAHTGRPPQKHPITLPTFS